MFEKRKPFHFFLHLVWYWNTLTGVGGCWCMESLSPSMSSINYVYTPRSFSCYIILVQFLKWVTAMWFDLKTYKCIVTVIFFKSRIWLWHDYWEISENAWETLLSAAVWDRLLQITLYAVQSSALQMAGWQSGHLGKSFFNDTTCWLDFV